MAEHDTKEDNLYYKTMRLKSAQLVVEVREAADYSYMGSKGNRVEQLEPGLVSIFHSPAKFKQDRFHIELKNRTELKDYIAMLVDFEKRFGDLLDQTQAPEE